MSNSYNQSPAAIASFRGLPIVRFDSQTTPPPKLNARSFHSWKYAAIITSLSPQSDPEELYIDTGCSPTIGDESYPAQSHAAIKCPARGPRTLAAAPTASAADSAAALDTRSEW